MNGRDSPERGGTMNTPPIMCTVDSCHYWNTGNECHASQILVTSDSFAHAQPDEVDAYQAGNLSPTPTDNCMETCCKTFVHRSSPTSAKLLDRAKRK